ncbi:MAG: nickel pincer cofactor biosynthesis protein LarB [Lachnospiraceae bacterium]|nr:nickel pincer cofactor biosynthesis protein LarB [Lachnospiraceae bacterium]
MNEYELRDILNAVKSENLSVDEALLRLKMKPFEDLGYAKVDYHRGVRQGVQEVIFGLRKTKEQIHGITMNMLEHGAKDILITRICRESADYLREMLPKDISFDYSEISRTGVVNKNNDKELKGLIVIASGGTSDLPVCEEAAITAETLGNRVYRMYDVGVAGIHRLLAQTDVLMQARVIIAVAGMEGALASVIGGLTDCPVIAVPTSVGYGASFGGISALLSMLNSCASGVSVVNIDNGFGAAYSASMINRMKDV